MAEETTEQEIKTPKPPEQRNPTGKGGFGDHPENRNPGGWKKENTFSYQMNRFKNMTIDELDEWNRTTPKSKRTVAEDLAFNRIFNAREDLAEFKEVADRTEGKAKQVIETEATVQFKSNKEVADDLEKILMEGSEEPQNEPKEEPQTEPVYPEPTDPTQPLDYENKN